MKAARKKLIAGSAIALVLISVFAIVANLKTVRKPELSQEGKPKYVFLFIGDGMGASHVAATESYISYKEGLKGGIQLSFTKFPVLGMVTTHSADRNVTCSSASGTAIACGEKTNNTFIGISPQGDSLKSIAYELKEKGYKIAIMSSVPVNHATPAAFYGHNTSRYDYYSLTKEIPQTGFDFFSGSGFLQYYGKDGNKKSSREILEDGGYYLCFSEEEFEKRPEKADKLILCQPSGKDINAGDYDVDPIQPDNIQPDDIMESCLEFLGDEKPFFVMYEGGEIDWAAHENKTMPMIEYILNFEKAVNEAIKFYRKHPQETLIIVTADHETGGISLGEGRSWDEVNIGWAKLEKIFEESGRKNYLSYEENEKLNKDAHIGWTTTSHTGGAVPIYAIGKGSERFSGRLDNTQIKAKILCSETAK